MSIAKSVLATTDRPVRLLYANRDRESVIFDDALDELDPPSRRSPRRAPPPRRRGRLPRRAPRSASSSATTATPTSTSADRRPFMDLVERRCSTLGDRPRPDRRRALRQRRRPAPQPSARRRRRGGRRRHRRGHDRPQGQAPHRRLPRRRHVLDTARRGGLSAPFSCEAGECATCMALVHGGHRPPCGSTTPSTPDEVEEGWVLTCQALPRSPTLTVEYEDL